MTVSATVSLLIHSAQEGLESGVWHLNDKDQFALGQLVGAWHRSRQAEASLTAPPEHRQQALHLHRGRSRSRFETGSWPCRGLTRHRDSPIMSTVTSGRWSWLVRLVTALLLLAVEFAAVLAAAVASLSRVCLDACAKPPPVPLAVPIVQVAGFFLIPGLIVGWGVWRRRPEIVLPGVLLYGLALPALVTIGF